MSDLPQYDAELVADGDGTGVTKEHVSTALDVVAALAFSGGAAWGLWRWLGPFALMVGAVLLFSINAAAAVARRERPLPPAEDTDITPVPPLPGPEDPGPLHVKGR
jgi:hypothetical protein